MTSLETEMTMMRLEHLANLSEHVVADVLPTLERIRLQCDYLIQAAEVMREQIDDVRDAAEVERLAGGPVRRVA